MCCWELNWSVADTIGIRTLHAARQGPESRGTAVGPTPSYWLRHSRPVARAGARRERTTMRGHARVLGLALIPANGLVRRVKRDLHSLCGRCSSASTRASSSASRNQLRQHHRLSRAHIHRSCPQHRRSPRSLDRRRHEHVLRILAFRADSTPSDYLAYSANWLRRLQGSKWLRGHARGPAALAVDTSLTRPVEFFSARCGSRGGRRSRRTRKW
jgi:hypothetical protein